MKLVKNKITNEYLFILENEFNIDIHIDRTDFPLYVDQYSHLTDYCLARDLVSNGVSIRGGFNSLKSDEEKEVALKYTRNVSDTDAVPYLMSKGLSLMEATKQYIDLRSIDIRNAADCYKDRLYSPEFTSALIMSLGQAQAETLLETCRDLFNDLSNTAILGTNYGNNRAGIMDWLEGTDVYIGSGLQGFTFDNGITYEETLKQLKDILYYGYTTE